MAFQKKEMKISLTNCEMYLSRIKKLTHIQLTICVLLMANRLPSENAELSKPIKKGGFSMTVETWLWPMM